MSEYDYFVESYDARHMQGKDLGYSVEYPAMIALVGKVRKKTLLDLGSGLGHHVAHYRKKGAIVTALDNSENMLAKISQKVATVHHDIHKKLPFEKESFDMVTASLVFDHLKKLKVFKDVYRILKKDGELYFSIPNPLLSQEKPIAGLVQNTEDVDIFGNYFAQRKIISTYDGNDITLYHRPLQEYFKAFFDAGFVLETFVEARPKNKWKKDPVGFAFTNRNPYFLLFKLRKK